jgi:8-oxo-dGTP pyrophosphatase MutT (NUDIX family)
MEETVGVIVLDKGGRHLMVKGVTGKWSFPKGRQKEGEPIYEAALREAREEAGIDLIGEKYVKKRSF